MTDEELIQKGVASVFKMLIDKGVITKEELEYKLKEKYKKTE